MLFRSIESDRAKGPLAVEVLALPHEAIAANNVVPFQITPRQTKLRVIYMEGSPLPEYRYIHDALDDDPDIECVSMSVDNMHAEHPRIYRFEEPHRGYPTTRAELLSYDVVICGDISRGAFTREQLEWTVELVGKRGGGFVMIGGNASFGTVASVDGKTLTLTEASGDTVKVKLTSATKITKTEPAKRSQIHPGDTITVSGVAGKQGTVSAATVTDSGARTTGSSSSAGSSSGAGSSSVRSLFSGG